MKNILHTRQAASDLDRGDEVQGSQWLDSDRGYNDMSAIAQ
jgi:hypothetical protein